MEWVISFKNDNENFKILLVKYADLGMTLRVGEDQVTQQTQKMETPTFKSPKCVFYYYHITSLIAM